MLGPGIHRGVSMEDYLALPYMSASKLEKLRRSPLQLRHSLTEPPRTSEALERGTALHLAILEPALFATRYVVAEPCGVLLGRSSKRAGEPCGNPGLFKLRELDCWACGTHVKGFGGQIDDSAEVITAENDAAVRGMAAAVAAHPRARTFFEGRGDFEVTIVFEDQETGVLVRIRPDRLIERAGMYVGLKSTRDAAEWAFPADAERRGYFRSLALYRRGLRAVDWPYKHTAVLAIESTPPFDLVPYLADEGDLDTADREVSRLLRRYADCTKDNFFPGYATECLTLRRPAWATKGDDFNG